MSTINEPNDLPDPNADCIALHKAFDDIGCDKKALMDVICHRNQQQRSTIRSMYGSKYEDDLLQRLRSKLHGDLEKAVLLWMCDPAERDAVIINNALKGWNKDQVTLTEVLYLRTSSQLVDIRRAYTSAFNRSLEEDIGIKTSGDEKKLLLAFVRQDRQCDLEPDTSISQADAKDLLSALAVRNAVDKAKIIRIFSARSPLQLKATIDYYKVAYGHSIGKVIKQEIKGAFQGSLRVAMKCAKNPINYFAKALYTSMKGLGTDDSTLIRIVVTRAEMDMKDIKAHFACKYRGSLQEMISSDTSGHYRTFLLLLIGTQPCEIQSGSFSYRFSSRR